MNWEFRWILLIPLLAAGMTAGVAVYAVSRWRVAVWVPYFFALMVAISIWSLGYTFEIAALELATKILFAKIEYLGIATVSLFWFLFAAHYAGNGKAVTGWRLLWLGLIPLVTIGLALTNERHLLIWRTLVLQETTSFLALKLEYGNWFWVHVAASYLLLAAGTLMIITAVRRFPVAYRAQLLLLIVGSLFPWLGNLYSLFDLGPIPELDWTPIGFALTGVIAAWAVFRLNLFDLVPVARRVTLDSMREGVVVLDLQNRIVDVNPAARLMFEEAEKEVIGRPLAAYLAHQPELITQYANVFEGDSLLTLLVQGELREYDLQISPLYDDVLTLRGRLFVLRDVTPRRRAESQLAASEARYRLVSEMVSDYAYAYEVSETGQTRLEWVTEAFARVTGYSATAMQGQGGWLTVVHPADQMLFRERLARLLAGEADVTEYRIVTRAGTVRWLRDVGRSLRDEQTGRVTHIYGAATDITESRKAREDLLAQKQLFESLVQVARATAEGPEIEKVLQNAVYVAATLTEAELGSLLLVDEDLRVTHSYLSGRENSNGQHDGLLQTVMKQGLAHWVVVNGQSTLIHDTFQDDRWVKLPGEIRPARSALAVPIMSGEQVLGVLTLQHSQVGFFRDEYVGLMAAAADQMALALRNAQMYDMQHRLADHQTVLYEVLRLISSHLTPETVVQTATEAITRLTNWTAVAILVHDEAANQFVVQSATGGLAVYIGKLVPVKLGNSERPFQEWEQPLPPASEGLKLADSRQVLSIPLWHGGERIGVFYVESEQKRPFSRHDRQLAEALAEAISLAMDNARTHVELREYAAGLSTLYTVTRQASSSLIIGDTLEKTLYAAITALGFEMGVITLLNPEDDLLHVEATFGFAKAVARQMKQGDLRGSVCEFVHLRQEPLQIDDVEQDFEAVFKLQPDMRTVLNGIKRLGARSYSGIPLLHRGESLGSLCLFSQQPRVLSLSEVSLQITIGQQIATALVNADLYEQARQQLREQTAIREAMAVMTSTIALPDVLARIAQQMCQVLGATSAYICSFDGETLYSTVLAEYVGRDATTNEHESDLGTVYYMPEQFPRDLQLIKVGWPTTIHANDEDLNAYEQHHLLKHGVKSLLVLPMQFGGKTVAYAEVWESRRRREFSANEVALGQAIAQQASIAFENARLFQSVENERTRLNALIQASRDGIVLIGTDNRIKVINQMALTLLGLPDGVEAWIERPLRQAVKQLRAISPQLVDLLLKEVARLRENDDQPGFGEFEANNYITQWLNLPVMAEGNRIGHLLIFRNVTDERRLGRMREDLVHTIVHDLRNPLSAVNICVELMTEQLASVQLSSEIYDYLGIVQRNTEKTTRLVDMILDINRLESGQMPISFRPVVLTELVDEVLKLQRPLAEEDQIHLEQDVPLSLPKVMIDANLIERVLQNLLDNALKTTPAGRGVIRVEARSASTESGRRVLVSVVDNGPGIPADIRDHMFQKFITGEGQRRRGTGLGLAFCRMAIDAHDEDIWVAQSERGVGTTITFSLPIALG